LAYFALAHMIAFHYVAVVLALIVTGLGGNLLFVIMDAVMVAIGNATASVGRLQALQQGIPLFIMAFVAHMKGYVTQHWSYSHCFTASALVALIGIPVAFLIQEKSTKAHRSEHLTESDRQAHHEKLKADKSESLAALKLAIKSPGLWAVVGFVFYLIFTPGINTAQFYYMTGPLHFSAQFIGSLDSYSSAGSIIALLLFSVLSKKIPVHSMVWGAFLMDCSVYLIMMLLKDENSAKYVTLIYAIVGMIYNLCLVTLAARACPPKIEGAIYGLVLSAIALAGAFGEKLGSAMYDYFGPASHHSIVHGWYSLLIWGFVFTALAVVFIPFLPKWTKSREPLTAAISS
jgi:Na+/melibiose symporter-like transporter